MGKILNQEDKYLKIPKNRRFARKVCMIKVNYNSQNRYYYDLLANICTGGVFIETDELFSVGTEILIHLSSESMDNKTVMITGKVIRQEHDGIGVSFNDLSSQQKDIIQKIMKS